MRVSLVCRGGHEKRSHHVYEVYRPIAKEGLQLLKERCSNCSFGQELGGVVERGDMRVEVLHHTYSQEGERYDEPIVMLTGHEVKLLREMSKLGSTLSTGPYALGLEEDGY